MQRCSKLQCMKIKSSLKLYISYLEMAWLVYSQLAALNSQGCSPVMEMEICFCLFLCNSSYNFSSLTFPAFTSCFPFLWRALKKMISTKQDTHQTQLLQKLFCTNAYFVLLLVALTSIFQESLNDQYCKAPYICSILNLAGSLRLQVVQGIEHT